MLWDGYRTLQDFMPGLEALTQGQGDQVIITQDMVDNALAVWTQMAAAASPELAGVINGRLAQHNDLQDFVGMSFDDWALAMGVNPPTNEVYLPFVQANN